MKKEFVTYEQALALKEELGFDEECIGYFKDKEFKYCLEDELVKNSLMSNSNSPIFYITRPLKSQVFRWFREKYKIRFFIQSAMSDLGEYFKLIFPDGETTSVAYPTYEEAENACIDKLIEIAKQQDNGR